MSHEPHQVVAQLEPNEVGENVAEGKRWPRQRLALVVVGDGRVDVVALHPDVVLGRTVAATARSSQLEQRLRRSYARLATQIHVARSAAVEYDQVIAVAEHLGDLCRPKLD